MCKATIEVKYVQRTTHGVSSAECIEVVVCAEHDSSTPGAKSADFIKDEVCYARHTAQRVPIVTIHDSMISDIIEDEMCAGHDI